MTSPSICRGTIRSASIRIVRPRKRSRCGSLRAIAAKDPPRQPDPVAQRPRRHDDHVEQAVVDRRVRQQLEAALQPSDIADQHRAGRPAQRRAVVDAQLHTASPGRAGAEGR